MADKVLIQGLQVDARVGATEAEKSTPQRLLVDITVEMALDYAAATDALSDTLDYSQVAAAVRALADANSWTLIETFAGEVAAVVREMSRATKVTVAIKKPSAAAELGAESIGIEISW